MIPPEGQLRTGVYPRGEDTRRRLIEAALEIFATEGYEGASTRHLAERAGVNLPAIPYYFGNKEGLYCAVVEHIVADIESRMGGVVARINGALAAGSLTKSTLTKSGALDLLCEILDRFVALVTDEKENPESRRLFFARAEIEDNPALSPLYDCIMRYLSGPCAGLIGFVLDQPADDERVLIRAFAIIGQVVIFCKVAAKRELGWTGFGDNRVNAIKSLVREHTQAIFAKAVGDESDTGAGGRI